MKSALFLLSLLPVVLSAEFLVGVGKDETTGKKGKGFDPSAIHPIAGDVIAFEFNAGQHSVVESTFENPCTPKEGGFNTGVQSVDESLPVDADGLPQIRITINDTQPLFFFDQAGGLCQQGAVLSINPTAEQIGSVVANAAKDTDAPSAAPPSTPAPSQSGSSSQSGQSSAPSESAGAGNGALQAAVPGLALVFSALLGFM